jgi:demethylspheroidene O-methyltransferase
MERAARPSWRDRWLDWRNRRLRDPQFIDFAWKFPLTRPIARRRSRALFDLVAGFAYAQVLSACGRLNLFEMLADTARDAESVAREIDWPSANTERLLKAAAAIGLVEKRSSGRYGLGIHGAALLGNPWIAKFVSHHDLFYADLADPIALLRGDKIETKLRAYWAYGRNASPDATAAYTALMAASQNAVAAEILHAYDFSRHAKLLDVGGGDGTFLKAVAARCPALDLVLFDLPGVIVHAAVHPRIEAFAGSFHTDSLPHGADVATLVRIVHDHDDPAVLILLRSIKRALQPGGVLIVAEPLAGISGMEAVTDAYFNLYFAAMGSGRTRTAEEIGRLGRQAGFGQFRAIPVRNPLIAGLVVLSD